MSKKHSLPLLSEVFSDVAEGAAADDAARPRKPSVEVARARLGGRTDTDEPSLVFAAGQHVSFERAPGERGHAVVLHASAREVHVLLDAARVRRFAPGELLQEPTDVPAPLAELAGDARVFGLLTEGQGVRYADASGTLEDGRLVERCRYGALVLRDDGVVVAVGFRKLWPATTGASPS